MGVYMENVNMNMVYQEIKVVRQKLEYLEDVLIPEEEVSESELKEINKLRSEAWEEHKKGQTIKAQDL